MAFATLGAVDDDYAGMRTRAERLGDGRGELRVAGRDRDIRLPVIDSLPDPRARRLGDGQRTRAERQVGELRERLLESRTDPEVIRRIGRVNRSIRRALDGEDTTQTCDHKD